MILVLLALALILSACATDRSGEQTAAALNATLSTEIAVRRMTATIDADRRLVTQIAFDNAGTQAARRQVQIIGTLADIGYPTPEVGRITPAAMPTNPAFIAATPTIEPIDLAGGGITRAAPTADPLEITDIPPTPLPGPTIESEGITNTPDASSPRVENVVTAASVGSNDCATGTASSFSASAGQIYVVMTAFNLTRGSTVVSRWFREAEQVATFDFTPGFDIDGACIWFFAEPVDFIFTPGAYRVEIDINGTLVGTTSFTLE